MKDSFERKRESLESRLDQLDPAVKMAFAGSTAAKRLK